MTKQEQLLEYVALGIAFVTFLILFVVFRYNKSALMIISASGSVFYALWGIIHHALADRLTKIIVYEYVLFAILVFLLLSTVLSF